jgi:hypothetical protein
VRPSYGRDLPPAVDPAQLDLPTGHEAEEQNQRRVLGGQRALRFHASAKSGLLYLGLSEAGLRKSFKELKFYKRRKRWVF